MKLEKTNCLLLWGILALCVLASTGCEPGSARHAQDRIAPSSARPSDSGVMPANPAEQAVQADDADVLAWARARTDVPVLIPAAWADASERPYRYLQAAAAKDSYSIDAYEVETPVPFNHEKELLEKDGPLSESRRIGAISGKKADGLPPLGATIPADAVSFPLSADITAYETDNYSFVAWKQAKWDFQFTGPSPDLNKLQELSAAWSEMTLPATSGSVKIVGGNRIAIYVTWDSDHDRYTLEIGDDIPGMKEIMNHFS